MTQYASGLTTGEKNRNRHSQALSYTSDPTAEHRFTSPDPTLPAIEKCLAKIEQMNRPHTPADQPYIALCDGTDKTSYFPGFPTFRHVPHQATCKAAKVIVFSHPSRNDNYMIQVT